MGHDAQDSQGSVDGRGMRGLLWSVMAGWDSELT
jgi:hypothetical protein